MQQYNNPKYPRNQQNWKKIQTNPMENWPKGKKKHKIRLIDK